MTYILAMAILAIAAAGLGAVFGLAAGIESERKIWKRRIIIEEKVTPSCGES